MLDSGLIQLWHSIDPALTPAEDFRKRDGTAESIRFEKGVVLNTSFRLLTIGSYLENHPLSHA